MYSGTVSFDFCFWKKGYAMVKFFGFMFALAAMVSSANAALLVSYQYDVDDAKDPTVVAAGINADGSLGAFSNNNATDVVQSSVNNTTTVRAETFSFSTTSPNSVTLNTMTFDAAKVGTGTRGITWTPTFKLDGVAVSSSLYSVSPVSGFGAYTVTFAPGFVIGSSVFEAMIAAQGNSAGTSTSFSLDNVNFNGTLVPEPASMAVFGLLGAGVAIRRLRRKA